MESIKNNRLNNDPYPDISLKVETVVSVNSGRGFREKEEGSIGERADDSRRAKMCERGLKIMRGCNSRQMQPCLVSSMPKENLDRKADNENCALEQGKFWH
jgi:hypothetical protein